jgi:site-specific DNA-cytosine methylase
MSKTIRKTRTKPPQKSYSSESIGISNLSGYGNTELKVLSGQFRPKDRDYNRHGTERDEQFETRKDDVSNAILTGDMKNCVQIVAMRGRNPDNPSDRTAGIPTVQRLEPNDKGLCNTLTSVQKDNLVLEASALVPKRTEYGKAIRKAYESGGVEESRRNMTELEPRSDGVANTITTVTKDNLLAEAPYITDSDAETSKTVRVGGATRHGKAVQNCAGGTILAKAANPVAERRGEEQSDEVREAAGDERAGHGMHKGHTWDVIADDVRIRKLTPRECLRLMGWKDSRINRIREAKLSNAQTYKQAGNGIVVTVLMAIFGELFSAPYRDLIEEWDYRDE